MHESIVVAPGSSVSGRRSRETTPAVSSGVFPCKQHGDKVHPDKGRPQIRDRIELLRVMCRPAGVEHGAIGVEGTPAPILFRH